jgi:hypothetical protein
MARTYKQLMHGISDYMAADATLIALAPEFLIMPPISGKEDYKHFPNGSFPFLGPAFIGVEYDENMQLAYPIMSYQLIYGARQSGVLVEEMMDTLLDTFSAIESVLFEAQRGTFFDMSEDILDLEIMSGYTFPTFYTEVEKDRKAFSIIYFTIKSRLASF